MFKFTYRDQIEKYNREKSEKRVSEYNGDELYNLGLCYMLGVGCVKNESLAGRYFQMSLEKSSARAYSALSAYYLSIDIEKAEDFAKIAYERLDGFGAKILATISILKSEKYGAGRLGDSASDMAKENDEYFKNAFLYLQKALEYGYPYAYEDLGFLYLNGCGCKKDCKKAVECFKKLEMQPTLLSAKGLGLAYLRGLGVVANLEKALEWFDVATSISSTDKTAVESVEFVRKKILEKNRNSLESKYYGFTPVKTYEIERNRGEYFYSIMNSWCLDDGLVLGKREDYLGEDGFSKYCLSVILRREDFSANLSQSVELLKDSSDKGCGVASFTLACLIRCYSACAESEKDIDKNTLFESYLKLAVEQNCAKATYIKGSFLIGAFETVVKTPSQEEGQLLIYKAMKMGDIQAISTWKNFKERDKECVKKAYDNQLIEELFARNDLFEILQMGVILSDRDREVNLELAVKCFLKASEMGDGVAIIKAIECYARLNDRINFKRCVIKCAEDGNAEMQYALACVILFNRKEGDFSFELYRADFATENGEHWLKKSAESGHKKAILDYAIYMADRDKDVAIEYFSKVIEEPKAKLWIAKLYEKCGDFSLAEEYYKKAFLEGEKEGYYLLGMAYKKQGKEDLAIEYFSAVSDYIGKACYYLAEIYDTSKKEYETAYELYKKSVYLLEREKETYLRQLANGKVLEYEKNKCPKCGAFFTKQNKKALFGYKTVCAKCGKKI